MTAVLNDVERFIRASYLGHSWLLVLLGAGSVEADLGPTPILGLMLIAFNFHCFGYVHNNLIDYPIDRTATLRSEDPLVKGQIGIPTAWAIALLQIPLSFSVAVLLNVEPAALYTLTIGYLATIGYNVYGKRCPIPPLTDALQGVAWSSLATFGALAVGDLNWISSIPIAFGFSYIFLINGVHGGLRDLENDLRHGKKTTATFFGAEPIPGSGQVKSTPKLLSFAYLAFVALVLPGALIQLAGYLPYNQFEAVSIASVWLATQALAFQRLARVVATAEPCRNLQISRNQLPLLLPPLILLTPMMAVPLKIIVVVGFVLPFFLFNATVRSKALSALSMLVAGLRRNPRRGGNNL
ncbi:MAG: UbiA prenyltransferase family protein [Pseudomonadota bacterium]